MKKKLQLNDLKVQSFVTNLENTQSNNIIGGAKDPSIETGCTALSCGIVRCTYTLELECFIID